MARLVFVLVCAVLLVAPGWAVPSLDVPACVRAGDWSTAWVSGNFTCSSGHGAPDQQTKVEVCYVPGDSIQVQYTAIDNNVFSPFDQCNDDLYEADAVEMFITEGNVTDTPTHYIEIEVSPRAMLFLSHITNPNDECDGIEGDLIPCLGSGVEVSAENTTTGWTARLSLPFSLLGGGSDKGAQFRTNFFRIDKPQFMNYEYSCWNPTFANPPCFHVPKYFGVMTLV